MDTTRTYSQSEKRLLTISTVATTVLAAAAAPLHPAVKDVRAVSRRVAIAVARAARRAGLAPTMSLEETERCVDEAMWEPRYVPLQRLA